MNKLKIATLAASVSGGITGFIVYFSIFGLNFVNFKFAALLGLVGGFSVLSAMIQLAASTLFVYVFKTNLENEHSANTWVFSIPFLSVLVIPLYAVFYSNLSALSPSVLGNIYLPFFGFFHVDMGRYLLICAAGGVWLAVFFITAIRFIIKFYRLMENTQEKSIKKYIFLFAFIFYFLTTSFVTLIYPPTGDEPHYLITARSIAADLDVNLENNYSDPAEYKKYSPGELDYINSLHTVRAKDGPALYTTHDMGLPFLISPFVKIGDRYLIQFFMNFMAALLCLCLYMMLIRLGISSRIASVTAMTASICMPLMAGSSLILTEIPSALIVSYSIYILTDKEKHGPSILFFALLAFLPWLHLKLMIFSAVFYLYYYYIVLKNRTFNSMTELQNNAPVLISAVFYVWFYYAVYGIIAPFGVKELHENIFLADPSLQMNTFVLDPFHFIISGLAVIFDRDYGLITYCLLYTLSLWGLIRVLQKKQFQLLLPFLLALPYLLIFLLWKDWTGSMTPARQLIPIVPVFVFYAAYFLESTSFLKTKLFKIFFVVSVFTSWLLAIVPPLRYGASKFKIYEVISGHLPRQILWFIPPFYENTAAGISVSSIYLCLILAGYYFYGMKRKLPDNPGI